MLHEVVTSREGTVQQTQNRDDFLLGSSLFTLVTVGAPSQALTQPPRSEEQVLVSFQEAATGMSREREASKSPTCYLLLSIFSKLQLEHIAIFAPKFMLISSCFTIKA